MHYGRIYIQYFALWSSHWPGGLIVCVFVCVSVLQQYFGTPSFTLSMHRLNGDQRNDVKGCRMTLGEKKREKKVPFLQTTADLIRDQYIDLLKDSSVQTAEDAEVSGHMLWNI